MTLTSLGKKFMIVEYRHDKNKFLLFNKEPATSGRSVHKYLCLIERVGNSFKLEGFDATNSIVALSKQVSKYVKSLPYDSDYFCPHFRAGLSEELIIHDYMRSLGFVSRGGDENYELVESNIYGYNSQNIKIYLRGINSLSSLSKSVCVNLYTGESSWIEIKVKREVEEIKKGIDSLLKPLLLTEGIKNINKSDKLKNVGDVDFIINELTGSYEIGSKDFKKELKKRLQETIDNLG